MKRTSETVFSIIGILLFALLTIGGFVLYGSVGDSEGTQKLVQEFITDENIKDVTDTQIITFITNFFLYLGVVSLVCTIIGVFSILLIRKKGSKTSAGKLLILTAILGSLLTVFAGFFASIAYLIAGITTTSKNKRLAKQG